MPPRSSRQPLRAKLPLAPEADPMFRWRGTGVSRLEGLADAVFAFTVTLLVVALEVPRDFSGLKTVMQGFPAFAATFALLMWFWSIHYTFFRRYGLEDGWTRFLNIAILLFIVFLAYPLKFLLAAAFANFLGWGESEFTLKTIGELSHLYILYGAGLGAIWLGYLLLYTHAYRLRRRMKLTEAEIILTRGSLAEMLANMAICLISICLALFHRFEWQPGVIYALTGPVMASIGWYHAHRAGQVFNAAPEKEPDHRRNPRRRRRPRKPGSPHG